MYTIEEYIQKRRDTVEAFAQFRPLYEACKNSTPLRNHAVWWKQVHFSQNDENEMKMSTINLGLTVVF
jgi:hypothetical protein